VPQGFHNPSEARATQVPIPESLSARNARHTCAFFGSALSRTDSNESNLDPLVDTNQTTTVSMPAILEHGAQESPDTLISFPTPHFSPAKFTNRMPQLTGATMKHPAHLQDYLEHIVPAIRHATGQLMGSMNAASHQP
jgi:hypothetical protein